MQKELLEAKSAQNQKSISEQEAFKKMEKELLETKLEKARMQGTLEAQEKVGS